MKRKSKIKKLLNKLFRPFRVFKKIFEFLKEIRESVFAFFLAIGVLGFLYFFDRSNIVQNYFPGLFFDILVFGIFIVIYNRISERKRDIKRWNEEIDDFRGWDEKEATYRIMGIIRRLNKRRARKIDLHKCYFKDTDLTEFNLIGDNFESANLEGAILNNHNLKKTNFSKANLRNAHLESADFRKAILRGIDLQGADLYQADLEGADISEWTKFKLSRTEIRSSLKEANLVEANFKDANLRMADFREAIVGELNNRYGRYSVYGANFQGADLSYANLRGICIIWTYMRRAIPLSSFSEWPRSPRELDGIVQLLSKAKTLLRASLDPEIETLIKEKFPQLIEEPAKESKNSGERKSEA
jgi:uncharacterized protein YjbI with pentapeptide repeats